MATWADFADADPELAGRVLDLFTTRKHHTMATLRVDGSPRISGTEVKVDGGQLVLGMMPGTRRAADLRRDPRLALHSQGVDPPEDDHGAWCGEARISGTAVELSRDAGRSEDADWFRIEVSEVVLTRLGSPADHLAIESWKPERGRRSFRR